MNDMLILAFLLAASFVSSYETDYLFVPGGRQIHRECVHSIPSHSFSLLKDPVTGKAIVTTADGQVLAFPSCSHAPKPFHGPAWKAWTQYQVTNKITALYGEWTVPPAPVSSDGQILYFWNGIEPQDNSAVLQPVLQYGRTPAGGGNFWGMASWYVSNIHAFHTQLLPVNPGDVVTGNNQILGNGSWVITGGIRGSSRTVSFTYQPPSSDYTYAYQVLEAYTITNCISEYPQTGAIVFDNISVSVANSTVTPTWEIMTQQPITCKEHAGVASPTEVSIIWNQ